MVSLRDGKTVGTDNDKIVKTPDAKERTRSDGKNAIDALPSSAIQSKKRKTPPDEDKENASPPSTPKSKSPQSSAEIEAESREYKKTPGRNGPIKPDDLSVTPDIKPFKGPPGKKVRKTALEKSQEYTQFCRENEGHTFHELHVCFDKGPNGSPTYDKSGFELDYHKVADWMAPKPYDKGAMVRGMDKAVEKRCHDHQRMAEIFFEKGEAPAASKHSMGADYWKDRVSKDLNIPWHKAGVEQFEEWEQKGFTKARRGEYENFSKADRDRMMRLGSGSGLRK